MTTIQLQEQKAIYVTNILDGFAKYENEILHMDAKQAYDYFLEKRRQYRDLCSYADFYYFALEKEAREKVNTLLTEQEKAYLCAIQPQNDKTEQLIFTLTDELLAIIVKLNEAEMLFSSIYFIPTDALCAKTYWGNYGQQYVVFWRGEDV